MADLKYGTIEQAVLDYGIWEDDLVLDIGCGPGNPQIGMASEFPRADILVDMNLELIPVYGNGKAKFVIADIQNLPFKDKIFQFCWCSHILEHVDDPKQACNELMRVAERGRIKTPSAFLEMLGSLSYHLWLVTWYSNVLIFEKKYNFLYSKDWLDILRSEVIVKWKNKWQTKIPIRIQEMIFDWVDTFNVEIIS